MPRSRRPRAPSSCAGRSTSCDARRDRPTGRRPAAARAHRRSRPCGHLARPRAHERRVGRGARCSGGATTSRRPPTERRPARARHARRRDPGRGPGRRARPTARWWPTWRAPAASRCWPRTPAGPPCTRSCRCPTPELGRPPPDGRVVRRGRRPAGRRGRARRSSGRSFTVADDDRATYHAAAVDRLEPPGGAAGPGRAAAPSRSACRSPPTSTSPPTRSPTWPSWGRWRRSPGRRPGATRPRCAATSGRCRSTSARPTGA